MSRPRPTRAEILAELRALEAAAAEVDFTRSSDGGWAAEDRSPPRVLGCIHGRLDGLIAALAEEVDHA